MGRRNTDGLVFKRPCRKCDKTFRPSTKTTKVCPDCSYQRLKGYGLNHSIYIAPDIHEQLKSRCSEKDISMRKVLDENVAKWCSDKKAIANYKQQQTDDTTAGNYKLKTAVVLVLPIYISFKKICDENDYYIKEVVESIIKEWLENDA